MREHRPQLTVTLTSLVCVYIIYWNGNSYIRHFTFHILCYTYCCRLQWSGPLRKSWDVCERWTGPDSVVSAVQLNNSAQWGSTRAEGVIYYKKGRLQTNYGCVFVLFLALHLSLSLSFPVLYIFTPQWVRCAHTHTHTHPLRVWLPPPFFFLVVSSFPLPPLLHIPSYFFFSLHITLTHSPFLPLLPLLPPPSPSLLGHVAAAPAEIIGAKAWGCYLHRNSMTPQAASGEGHRDHLSQNFNENFCWDRDFLPSTPPPFPNFYSSSVPSILSDPGAHSSLLP